MKKFCGFPEIGQYRGVIKNITDKSRFIGLDENDKAKFDYSVVLPTLKFIGTCKMHGTNAGVTMNTDCEIYGQSRENILSVEKDNAGFARFVESNKPIFLDLFKNIDFNGYDYITIFGEWCGCGIQKNVAISKVSKRFIIFDIKLSYHSKEQGNSLYLSIDEIKKLRSVENNIFNIYDYKTFEIDIDFNTPETVQNELCDLTIAVETECPVGKAFGIEGIGEGIVWTHQDETGEKFRFKVKGEKHGNKVVKLASVNTEKLASINDFVEYAVTESRLLQGLEKVFGDSELDLNKTGDFLRWLTNDVIKEELDTLKDNGLEPKDVVKCISNKGRIWFLTQINKI